VRTTYDFVREILEFAADQGALIKAAVVASDRERPDSVIVRSVLGPPIIQEVIAELTHDLGEGPGGYARRQRTGVYRAIRMPVFDRFTAKRKERIPPAYLIPPRLGDVVSLLRRQGILVDANTQPAKTRVEAFTVESLSVDSLFEGHRTVRLEGRWSQAVDTALGAGWFLVKTNQPLGVLAAYLLEPASEDGIVTWNLLDRELQPGAVYPIHRLLAAWRGTSLAVP
jgi:hypothetical protein